MTRTRKTLIGAAVGCAGVAYGAVHAAQTGYPLTAVGFAVASAVVGVLIAREWVRSA